MPSVKSQQLAAPTNTSGTPVAGHTVFHATPIVVAFDLIANNGNSP